MKYRYRIKPVKDAPLFEVENPAGESWVDIPDEEINEFAKKRLIEIANNDRLFNKYRKEILEMLDKELQLYATKEFYEKGRGEMITDSMSEEELEEVKKAFNEKINSLFDSLDNEYIWEFEWESGTPDDPKSGTAKLKVWLEYWDEGKNNDGIVIHVWLNDGDESGTKNFDLNMASCGINPKNMSKEECLEQINKLDKKVLEDIIYDLINTDFYYFEW